MAHCSDIAWQQRQAVRGENDEVEILQLCLLGWSRASAVDYPKIIIVDRYGREDSSGTTDLSRYTRTLFFNTNPEIRNYINNTEWHILEELFIEYYGTYIRS